MRWAVIKPAVPEGRSFFPPKRWGSSLGVFEGVGYFVHFEGLIILTHSQSVVIFLFFSKVHWLSVTDYGTSEDLLICKPMSHFQRSERLWYDLIWLILIVIIDLLAMSMMLICSDSFANSFSTSRGFCSWCLRDGEVTFLCHKKGDVRARNQAQARLALAKIVVTLSKYLGTFSWLENGISNIKTCFFPKSLRFSSWIL